MHLCRKGRLQLDQLREFLLRIRAPLRLQLLEGLCWKLSQEPTVLPAQKEVICEFGLLISTELLGLA